MNEEEIKTKMKQIADRWVGKPEAPRGSQEYFKRGFDRLIYEQLQKRLKKIRQLKGPNIVPPTEERDIVDVAKEIFELE